jgi:hypothetical protein
MTGAAISMCASPAFAQPQVAGMPAFFKHPVVKRLSAIHKVASEIASRRRLPAANGPVILRP